MGTRLELITRGEARILKRPRFYDGNHCKDDHYSERYTANGVCCECTAMNARRRSAMRSDAQKEQDREENRAYWEANKDDINARRRAQCQKRKERRLHYLVDTHDE